MQFQDALLWKARTPAGLIALRAGLTVGTMLDRGFLGALWMASGERRRLFRRLRSRTEPLENTLR